MKRVRELNLLLGFIFLLVLLGSVGLVGILQIQQLSRTVEYLGRHSLITQEAVLQMRISNNLWVSGVRNFVFWKTAKVLESLPAALDYSQTQTQAAEKFDHYLSVYSAYAQSPRRKEWVKRLENSEVELRVMGNQIIQLLSESDSNIQEARRLFAVFENRFYEIDDFLNDPLGKDNLEEVSAQLTRTRSFQIRSILLLSVCSVLSVLTGGAIAFFVYRSRKLERQKREALLQQLMKIEEDERRSLSFQIHNEMGQDLSALKIYLGLIEKKLPEPSSREVFENIRQCRELISRLLEKSHSIAYFLRPSSIDETGIVATIEALILQCQSTTGINFDFRKPESILKLSGRYNLLLYRITQEAITNIVKYARAQNVQLAIELKEKVIQLDIKDDGIGFDYNRFLQECTKDKLGLLGLRERVELFGGRMRIDTALGRGTRITVKLSI